MQTIKKTKPSLAEQMQRTKEQAKKEVAFRGVVQYRVDEETMLRLMAIADKKKVPFGVLARMWMVERLDKEEAALGLFSAQHAV